jgi:hypothetical protein
MTFPRERLVRDFTSRSRNAGYCHIPHASPGMMCACGRRMLADKDFDQPVIGLQQTGSNPC